MVSDIIKVNHKRLKALFFQFKTELPMFIAGFFLVLASATRFRRSKNLLHILHPSQYWSSFVN